MSQVTEKWNKDRIPGPDEVLDRLYEILNVDADDFYTDGKIDYPRALKNGVTHLIQSIMYNKSDGVVNWKIPNIHVGYVYLILSDNGLTKIGRSENPEERLYSLQQNSPCQLTLYHSQFVKNSKRFEKFMHLKFRCKRVRGEWFNLSQPEIDEAKRVMVEHQWVTN